MTGKLQTFVIVYLLVLFNSCKKDEVGTELDVVEITFSEQASPENTMLFFQCSGGNFECENVCLNYSVQRTEKAFYFDFGKSYLCNGSDCYHTTGYNTGIAKAFFSLGKIEIGSYLIEVSNKDEILRASLKIDDKKIILIEGAGKTASFSHSEIIYNRIPKDAVWGYAWPEHSDLDPLLDTLYSMGMVQYAPLLENGNYSSFRISNGTYTLDINSLGNYSDFLLKSTLDTAELKNVMLHFATKLYVYTGKGDYFTIN